MAQYEIGQSSVVSSYTINDMTRSDSDNTKIQDRKLSVEFSHLLNSHIVLTEQFYLKQIRLKQFASRRIIKQLFEVSGMRFYFNHYRQGWYIASSLGLGWKDN